MFLKHHCLLVDQTEEVNHHNGVKYHQLLVYCEPTQVSCRVQAEILVPSKLWGRRPTKSIHENTTGWLCICCSKIPNDTWGEPFILVLALVPCCS